MKGNEQHEMTMTKMLLLRQKLFNASLLQPSTTEAGACRGKVLLFSLKHQLYGVQWEVESEWQDPLAYVGLEMLLVFCVDTGMKEIVRTLMEFEKNRVSSTSTPSTSDNASSHIVATAPSASSAASNKRMPVPAGTGEHTGQEPKKMLETEAAAAAGAADQSMHYPATR